MKIINVVNAVLLVVILASCSQEQPIIPNKTVSIDTLQDMQRIDTIMFGGLLYEKEVVIRTEGEYRDLEKSAIEGKFIMEGRYFPNIDFSNRTVIGMGNRADRLADENGGITESKFIALRDDSAKRYTFISRVIYPDGQPRYQSGYIYITHLYSVPKLLPDYDIVFIRDTI